MAPDSLSPTEKAALVRLGQVMKEARDPWCLIGGAAALLHGAEVSRLRDIDVLVSLRDARAILDRLDLAPEDKTASVKFRSACFGTWDAGGMPVEFMADFSVFADGKWIPVVPEPAETIGIGEIELFLPSLEGLIAMYRLFDRDKDRERIAALEALARRDPETVSGI